MLEIKRNRKANESNSMYFNGYTYDTVPDVPSIGGIPQYNPMIVDDRIELMDEVIKQLEDYWYSEDPKLEDEITRITKRDEVLYVKDIYWKLENPDVVTVKFGLVGFNGSNDRVAETREIEINFESFLGRDIEGDLVRFLSKRINSLLDSVLHGGLYNECKNMKEDKSLEYRIKRLERMIRNHRTVKNESVGRKMFVFELSNAGRNGMYFIGDNKRALRDLREELSDLYYEQEFSDLADLCDDNNIIVVGKHNSDDLPMVLTYEEFLDGYVDEDDARELSHLSMDDVLLIDEDEQVHELVPIGSMF